MLIKLISLEKEEFQRVTGISIELIYKKKKEYLRIDIPTQDIFVFISKFQLYIVQKFIDIRQLQYFLVGNDEYQFEFIIQFVL